MVVAVAVGREGSKRSVVAAGSGRTVTTGWTLEGDSPRHRERRACLAQIDTFDSGDTFGSDGGGHGQEH